MNPPEETLASPVIAPLKRLMHWPELLHQFVKARRATPFQWGRHDCALFAADAVNSMTCVDLAADLREQYSSLTGAMRVAAQLTGKNGATVEHIAEHFSAQAGMTERKSHLFAQRGDLVLFDSELGPALGIVYLDGIHALFVAKDGLNKIKLRECRRAWKV